MSNIIDDVLEFIDDNDVKFVRLAYCDLLGVHKNVSIMSNELGRAFAEGISFDGSNVKGFSCISNSDLLLKPDPTTLSVLPWRPQQGRVIRFYCNIFNGDSSPYESDGRYLLQQKIKQLNKLGYNLNVGTECEFYLFRPDEKGNPTKEPYDYGGYMDIAPLDKGENIRREICLCLEEMGIVPLTSHHERGNGQNEIDFMYSDPLLAADNFLTFKSVVKNIASRNGLYASFLPKPLIEDAGSGLHLNLSLTNNDGENIFGQEGKLTPEAKNFMAGILNRAAEISAVINPLKNSYQRLGQSEAPKFVTWGYNNRSNLIRIPGSEKDNMRMELRNPDCAINPYLALSLLICAGIEGLEQNLELPAEQKEDMYNVENAEHQLLPLSLTEALKKFAKSKFVERTIGPELLKKYLFLKEEENRNTENEIEIFLNV